MEKGGHYFSLYQIAFEYTPTQESLKLTSSLRDSIPPRKGAGLYINIYRNLVSSYDVKPQRIISLSPSVTESLYFLNQLDKVIAVTRYCEYPPEAVEKPKVGGIYDVNYEAVAALKPDLVILSDMQAEAQERFRNIGINTLLLRQADFESMLDSLRLLGNILGAEQEAAELIKEIKHSVNGIVSKISSHESKRVLFMVSREVDSRGVTRIIAAGNDGYYSEILKLLQAQNPFDKYVAYSNVSREGLYWIDPEVIIELLYNPAQMDYFYKDWRNMQRLTAVKSNQICPIANSYGYIPGPRFPLLLEATARCIYPEAFP